MKIGEAFPSEYLKESDLKGKRVRLTVSHIEVRKIGDDEKPCIVFKNTEKVLALNKTNANTIGETYGDEMDDWEGKSIILFPAKTEYQGKRVPCIRVEVPPAQKGKANPVEEPPPPDEDVPPIEDGDDPF